MMDITTFFHIDLNLWAAELEINDSFGAYFCIEDGEVYMLKNDDQGNSKKLKYEEFKAGMEMAIKELKTVIEEDNIP